MTAQRKEGDIGRPQNFDGTEMFWKMVCGEEQTVEGQSDISE